MKGRTPTADEQRHMDRVAELGCVVCRLEMSVSSWAAIHHCDGKTKPGAHFKTLGLCGLHHQGGANNEIYTSRHPWKAEFEKRYGTEKYLMEQTRKLLEAI